MSRYISATSESGKKFYQDFHDKGKVVMLNLLKFRSQADYTNSESLKPSGEITGREAYQLYTDSVLPLLKKAGSQIVFYGKSESFMIGPESERWDAVILVEYPSVLEFMAFAQNEDYLKIAGHRTAALEDARLLPMSENEKYT